MTEQPLLMPGLHEHLVTSGTLAALDAESELRPEFANVDPADQSHVLARHIYQLTLRALEGRTDPRGRIQLLNDLVVLLEDSAATVDVPARQLRRLARPPGPGVIDIGSVRPKTPLSDAALLTNNVGEPNLAAELRAEIDTSDEVDLLCAFVKWHGLRLLEDELARLHRRQASRFGSSPRPTWAPPNGLRSIGSSESWAPKCESSTTRPHPPARQGLDVSAPDPLRHGLRRFLKPLSCRASRRGRVERPAVPGRDPCAARQVPRHLRYLLERHRASSCTTRTATGTGLTMPSPKRRAARQHDRVTISLSGLEVRPVRLPAADARRTGRRAQGA